jgi:lipoate-protein ligase B
MQIRDIGIVPYEEALRIQHEVLFDRIAGNVQDTLILAEHFPVVTLGRLSDDSSVPGRDILKKDGINVVRVSRGGKATFHSPGQLLLYPIIKLDPDKRDIGLYIDLLEKAVSRALNLMGIPAERLDGRRGVWLFGKKIAFTGIAIKRWVTYHGAAVNINNDTERFSSIHPCGDSRIEVTSAKEYLGRALEMDIVRSVFAEVFAEEAGAGLVRIEKAVNA